MSTGLVKRRVDDWLNDVKYPHEDEGYIPSDFALNYINFIKLVNGEMGESHKTPVVHYKMLDLLAGKRVRLANLCSRGFGKSLSLDEVVYTDSGTKTIAEIQVGESIYGEDGKQVRIITKSEVFNKPMYALSLADGRTLKVCEDHINVVIHKRRVRYGKKNVTEYQRRNLTTKELLRYAITSPRTKTIKNPTGVERNFWVPNCSAVEYTEKDLLIDPYTLGILLGDGRIQKDSGYPTLTTHRDDLPHYKSKIPYLLGSEHTDLRNSNVITLGIRKIGKQLKALGVNVHGNIKAIPDEYLYGSKTQRMELLRGLMDTDGTITKEGCASFCSNSLYLRHGVITLVRSLGGIATESKLNVNIKSNLDLFSLERKRVRQTQVSTSKVAIVSVERIADEPSQCLYVGNASHTFLTTGYTVTHNTVLFGEYLALYIAVFGAIEGFGEISGAIYVSDSVENGVKSLRKNIEYRYNNSDFLKQYLPVVRFTDVYIEFTNADGHQFGLRLFGAKTGLRGTKIFGKRPVMAILDDLVSDDDSRSATVMSAIKDTVYKGVDYALDPTKRKIVFSGTPFNQNDILYEAVESGGWYVNVLPICEEFPCTKEDFRGAWEDRFTYDFVKEQYDVAVATGQLASFNQELMLRIMSEEDRLIRNSDVVWYERENVLSNRGKFNFYITTDFATSKETSADFSVISVWAYNNNGDWLWVDGTCARQTMDVNIKELFEFTARYKPQQVGIEVSGQQGGFIAWIQNEMVNRNNYFALASEENKGKPGIRPNTNKIVRFNVVVPLFKTNKIWIPKSMDDHPWVKEFNTEISLVSASGSRSKNDDILDTVSMLASLTPWKPSEVTPVDSESRSNLWDDDEPKSNRNSYIV